MCEEKAFCKKDIIECIQFGKYHPNETITQRCREFFGIWKDETSHISDSFRNNQMTH